jgi:DHA1 family bicyclomycin/chloramphenicol resistance-like MFS transporter
MVALGLLNARLVRHIAVRRLLVIGLAVSTLAAVALVVVVAGTGAGLLVVLPLLFVVVATRGLVSANATVLGVARTRHATGAASAVLGACMFAGGIVVSPLLSIGADQPAVPMAAVVAGGAAAALLATTLLARGDRDAARRPDRADAVRAQPIEE